MSNLDFLTFLEIVQVIFNSPSQPWSSILCEIYNQFTNNMV